MFQTTNVIVYLSHIKDSYPIIVQCIDESNKSPGLRLESQIQLRHVPYYDCMKHLTQLQIVARSERLRGDQ